MDRTCRLTVIALGAVTLSNVVNVARLSGQTTPAVIWNFDSLSPGQPPAGFSFGRTAGGRVGHWIVQSASDAPSPSNVLAQVDSDRTDYRFPVAAALSPSFTDGSVSVKCKPVSRPPTLAKPHAPCYRRRSSAFTVTVSVLALIASAAHAGLSRMPSEGYNTPAASGIAIRL